ncbi:MAG: integrase [Conexibacter sp.]|nr:integrase [Conexibacter sp.]
MDDSNATRSLDLIPRGAATVDSPIRTVDDLVAAFLIGYGAATRDAYGRDLRQWTAWLAHHGLAPLSAHRAHVELWARGMEARGLAASTVARRLSALAGFYDYALDEELITRSPVSRVRRPRVGDESPRLGLDRDELGVLLAAAHASGARDYALACLLTLNGLRISETLALDADDLGAERGHRTAALRRKGGKRQSAPLAPRTADAIDLLLAGRNSGPVFVTRTGRRMDRHAAAKVVRRLARSAGITATVSPHSLRHSFVTLALDAGVPLHRVQDAAGHADPRTTRRYDRARFQLDQHATYSVAAAVA